MLRELHGEMFRRACANRDRPHYGTRRRFIARNLDNKLGGTAFDLAREARARFRHTRPVKHVDLVVARRVEALEPFAHHYTAARAGEHAATVMRDINALLQQAAKKYFAFVETQFEDFHRPVGLLRQPSFHYKRLSARTSIELHHGCATRPSSLSSSASLRRLTPVTRSITRSTRDQNITSSSSGFRKLVITQ